MSKSVLFNFTFENNFMYFDQINGIFGANRVI